MGVGVGLISERGRYRHYRGHNQPLKKELKKQKGFVIRRNIHRFPGHPQGRSIRVRALDRTDRQARTIRDVPFLHW